MEIRELGADALADDAVMGDVYEVERRAELHGREQAPFLSLPEFLGARRSPDSAARQQLFTVYDGDTLLASAPLWTTLLDNTDKAFARVYVDPSARRRGLGRMLTEHLEEQVRAAGRALLMLDAKLPYEGCDDHPYRLFADALGFELANYEVIRHLALPVPDDRLRGWAGARAPYTVETFVDDVPAGLVESLCTLLGLLAVDAPSGAVDFEEAAFDAERFAEEVASGKAMGRARYETVAYTPERRVVAQTTLEVPLTGDTVLWQGATFVHRAHRGHGLGLAVKAANLRAVQSFRDDLTLITTQNAETNDHMVVINDLIGFRPVEVSAEFVKRF